MFNNIKNEIKTDFFKKENKILIEKISKRYITEKNFQNNELNKINELLYQQKAEN